MDKDGCDSSRIRLFWYFPQITLWWNFLKSWTVDIFELNGLCCYQEESYEDGHKEWKIKQGKKPSVRFYNPATNTVIYFSYLMATSENYLKE